ncbi:9644_t:CDS:2 [Cetraspora pellucida]|uniref:9644_t:CDS:1 n=1 Tax=Cetraspora pellucida TaxID=1433469 RepID=A0A9N8YVQ2_9GLOM|nr:9644_t:CDS:2 [Cetraspora pellucida]
MFCLPMDMVLLHRTWFSVKEISKDALHGYDSVFFIFQLGLYSFLVLV